MAPPGTAKSVATLSLLVLIVAVPALGANDARSEPPPRFGLERVAIRADAPAPRFTLEDRIAPARPAPLRFALDFRLVPERLRLAKGAVACSAAGDTIFQNGFE